MRFEDVQVSAEHFYALGRDCQTGGYYLAIPVANRLVNYDEYYSITPAQFDAFRHDPPAASEFADRCRRRELDELLIFKPGSDRGAPF
ncbi:hypothetical protein [Phenylobacterium soli]|uniref:Uncharacterized protein n=1 Tax=Phenylobacterium soli TaxID=2170551 RepID=A0A328AAY5_9CAUL|nr:hypothetical protein [Phenylobacterium soli]RAK51771.1 hypothetical protein DJ017_18255 [Phenylobacterium soli]